MDNWITQLSLPKSYVCARCGEPKTREEMRVNCTRKDGVGSWCKECERAYYNTRRAENPEKYRQQTREWREKNPEKVVASNEKQRRRQLLEASLPIEYDLEARAK